MRDPSEDPNERFMDRNSLRLLLVSLGPSDRPQTAIVTSGDSPVSLIYSFAMLFKTSCRYFDALVCL